MTPDRKHYYFFDYLRAVSCLVIIAYHMAMQLVVCGIYREKDIMPYFSRANINFVMAAVAVFFILSGASLSVSYTKNSIKDVLLYYKKRYLRLLVPFYITVIAYDLYKIYSSRSLASVFIPKVKLWKWGFTLLGLDEWVSMHGKVTFSNSVGEWFLGALVIMYAFFPLLFWLMEKNRCIFFAAATVLYIVVVQCYNTESVVPIYCSLPVKGYEFVLGMIVSRYYLPFKNKIWIGTVAILALFLLSPSYWDINVAYKVTVFAIACFITASFAEDALSRQPSRLILLISNYSYEIFLVHHVVIYIITPKLAPRLHGSYSIALLVLIQAGMICLAAYALKKVSKLIFKPLLK